MKKILLTYKLSNGLDTFEWFDTIDETKRYVEYRSKQNEGFYFIECINLADGRYIGIYDDKFKVFKKGLLWNVFDFEDAVEEISKYLKREKDWVRYFLNSSKVHGWDSFKDIEIIYV